RLRRRAADAALAGRARTRPLPRRHRHALRDVRQLQSCHATPSRGPLHVSTMFNDRLQWIERALQETRDWIKREREEAATERMFATPGGSDSDFEYAYNGAVERQT